MPVKRPRKTLHRVSAPYIGVLLSDRGGFSLERGVDNSTTLFNITVTITSYIFT